MDYRDATMMQRTSREFYEELVPKVLIDFQHTNVPKAMQSSFLLSPPRPLLETVTISHIACIGNDRIIVSFNGLQTKIFNHTAPKTRPFKENNWEVVVHLTEVDG